MPVGRSLPPTSKISTQMVRADVMVATSNTIANRFMRADAKRNLVILGRFDYRNYTTKSVHKSLEDVSKAGESVKKLPGISKILTRQHR